VSGEVRIREARAEDAEAAGEMVARSRREIHRVRREALGDELTDLAFPEMLDRKRRSAAELVRGDPRRAFIAEVGGRMAGLVCWDVRSGGEIGELVEVTVDPDFQGRGIATAMCRRVLDLFRERGCRAVLVKTGLDPGHARARKLYEKLGFGPGIPWIHYYQKIGDLSGEGAGGD
jgi:ribosomal protein S18 acetylase RimI-like enzyme